MAFSISSPAFVNSGDIPRRYTCDGEGISPHVVWAGAPDGTRSFVLIVDDPDAPRGTFTHWVVFDVLADRTDIPSGTRTDEIGLSGLNSVGKAAYMGPCPPSGTHRYFFRLSALDIATLGLTAGATREAVERAMTGHVLGTAELMGRYQRRRT